MLRASPCRPMVAQAGPGSALDCRPALFALTFLSKFIPETLRRSWLPADLCGELPLLARRGLRFSPLQMNSFCAPQWILPSIFITPERLQETSMLDRVGQVGGASSASLLL